MSSGHQPAQVNRLRYGHVGQPLHNLGTEADVEVGFIDPHPVQDAGKLAHHRDGHARDGRAQHARPIDDPQAPRPQGRPFPDP